MARKRGMAASLCRRHGMGRSKVAQERRRVGKMFCLCLLLAAVVMFSRQSLWVLQKARGVEAEDQRGECSE